MEKDKPFLEVPKQLSHSLAIWAIYAHAHLAPPVAKFGSLIIEIELLSCLNKNTHSKDVQAQGRI